MGAIKVKSEIPKDWFLQVDTPLGKRRVIAAADRAPVAKLDDLPEYISAKQVGEKLNTPAKTVADWMAKKYLKSVKIRGRRFTTAAWLRDFIEREDLKNG